LQTEPGVFFRRYDDEAALTDHEWIALATGGDTRQVFGLFDGDRLVGITGIAADRDDPTGATASLGMSYILPEYRRRGYATAFYEVRLAWARARPHFVRASVGHRQSNNATRRAAARFGFRPIDAKLHRWPDGSEENHVSYELQLRDER